MKKMVTLVMVLNLAILTAICTPSLAEIQEFTENDNFKQNSIFRLNALQDVNETEPQPVNLYFYDSGDIDDPGDLKAEMPAGNASTDVDCPGYPIAKAAGYWIGTWRSTQISQPITVEPTISCNLWVRSDEGANGVHFNVQIRVNGDSQFEFMTDSTSVPNTPVEITGEGSGSGPLQLQTGDTIGVRLAYFSDSRYFIGPGANSILIVGGSEYDTHITITAAPITLSVAKPVVDKESKLALFIANFTDAFSSTRLNARLMVTGEVDVNTISDPVFILSGNESSVNWLWDYKTDKAKCGEYTISVFLSYSEENEFFATGSYMMEFSEPKEDGGLLAGLGWLLPLIIVVVIIAVTAVVIKVIMGRRSAKISET